MKRQRDVLESKGATAREAPACPSVAAAPREAELQRLVHELQIHQIELEMQNEALLEAQAELLLGAAVFAHSYDAIMVCDPGSVIVDVNPAFTRITGFTK